MTPEEKIIEKIRKVLVADTTIANYVKTRVYASHVSSIDEPKYPAISIHMFPSSQDFANRGFVRMQIQIDIWMHGHQHNVSDLYTVAGQIRSLLDRANLRDTTIGLDVAEIAEIPGSPMIRENDTDLLHLPTRYRAVAT